MSENASVPDNSASIAQLEAILNAGLTSGVVDGQSVTFASPADIRKRISDLKLTDDDQTVTRPRAATISLGGF